ncbi:MAG: helix-turn-helix transcriptional regulator [Methanobrevibacter sp.]|nr:helix-turn-helix transcriptional regulator [Methanobrevibacter sp.]
MSKFEEKIKVCPLESSLELINKKWIILIVRDLFFGKTRFSQFKESNPEMSNAALSRCLAQMEEDNLIKKTVDDNSTSYELTENGKKLNRIVYELVMFTLNTNYNDNFSDEAKTAIEKIYREKLDL